MMKFILLGLAVLFTPMLLGYLGILLTFEAIDFLKTWAERRQEKSLGK